MTESCCGCKFLYGNGEGYSNYTWMDTIVRCALGKNPLLSGEVSEPYDWSMDPNDDNLPATANSRCERYSPGPYFTADPDREDHPADLEGADFDQVEALCNDAGYAWPREPN